MLRPTATSSFNTINEVDSKSIFQFFQISKSLCQNVLLYSEGKVQQNEKNHVSLWGKESDKKKLFDFLYFGWSGGGVRTFHICFDIICLQGADQRDT